MVVRGLNTNFKTLSNRWNPKSQVIQKNQFHFISPCIYRLKNNSYANWLLSAAKCKRKVNFSQSAAFQKLGCLLYVEVNLVWLQNMVLHKTSCFPWAFVLVAERLWRVFQVDLLTELSLSFLNYWDLRKNRSLFFSPEVRNRELGWIAWVTVPCLHNCSSSSIAFYLGGLQIFWCSHAARAAGFSQCAAKGRL